MIESYCARLAEILANQDPVKKADISYRTEGIFEAVKTLAESTDLPASVKETLRDAIFRSCEIFNLMTTITVARRDKRPWPVNSYANRALEALGFPRPTAMDEA